MPRISQSITLDEVEHIVTSGTGVLDFAVVQVDEYYTWTGREDADWSIEDVDRVENIEEDRLVVYPEGETFVCEIAATSEEHNDGPVRCYCR